jgi:hypothetical protein
MATAIETVMVTVTMMMATMTAMVAAAAVGGEKQGRCHHI